ncbi:MAG: endonuclease III [Candidatus Firestonebacteria bacterium RIFOXYC2_FULL_39_67]|nr:MAG: endonuclease III [Candidatus Firestonebacteria bacterium RIFOXYD2_FULL_39_29]OGF52050.1 MAG: endonuclease III [Candidatus Firestonebacteria bacterium RifOxyC12_full_39_7]OGF54819.1 MAG: endonuclease III [Candidatus Firestonebacteria bacterium RIFOXYC2_FULL_39_67]
MVTNENIDIVIKILKKEIKKYKEPIVGVIAKATKDPFKVLISTMISLRTKDDVTTEASKRLFLLAGSPAEMIKLTDRAIEKAIYPAGFYRVKAKAIKKTAGMLLENFGGKVPDTLEELLTLSGVGRKTSNLVMILGFNKYGICVDIHVHRITNRWGYVKTKNPEKTEFALRKKLPKKHWKIINDLLVTYGQNLCHPVSPKCTRCKIAGYCGRIGVTTKR